MPPPPNAFFLEHRGRQCLTVFHAPATGIQARSAVLHVHAFAEEMNKARRMIALQARALAQAGHAVLLLDLMGCGDSSGEFGDAGWDDWIADVLAGCDWLRQRVSAPLWLWGLRAGCLLSAAAAAQLTPAAEGLLLWQPPASGQMLLNQFLRLKAAGNLAEGQAKAAMDDVRQRLAQGQAVEIAGYTMSAALADGMAKAAVAPPRAPGHLIWLELTTRAEAGLSPAADKTLGAWRAAGWLTDSAVVNGPAFWQTTEIEDAPALLAATASAMDRAAPAVTR